VIPPIMADARAGLRHVFVHDLVLMARIGVPDEEQAEPQRLRLFIDLAVIDAPHHDDIANVVCYGTLAARVRELVAGPPVRLVETLAEATARICLEDLRVRSVRVRIEKPDILPDAGAVGVVIERFNPLPWPAQAQASTRSSA
jgi:7,8-dihydroneopterin aldolase/epimerase/oxygenase